MIAADFGDGDVLLWLVEFFLFLIYFWLLVIVIGDLFRDHELSGWAKAVWVLFILVAPMLGILLYLIFRGQGMGRRSAASAREAQERFDAYVRNAGGGGQSPTEQIAHAKSLLDSGAIDQGEYDRLKAKALA
jgi:hypothetical protein